MGRACLSGRWLAGGGVGVPSQSQGVSRGWRGWRLGVPRGSMGRCRPLSNLPPFVPLILGPRESSRRPLDVFRPTLAPNCSPIQQRDSLTKDGRPPSFPLELLVRQTDSLTAVLCLSSFSLCNTPPSPPPLPPPSSLIQPFKPSSSCPLHLSFCFYFSSRCDRNTLNYLPSNSFV